MKLLYPQETFEIECKWQSYNQIMIITHVVLEISFISLSVFDDVVYLTTCVEDSINLQEEPC